MLGTAAVEDLGHVAVALPLPEKYSDALNQLEQSEQRYQELRRNNKLIRQTYMQAAAADYAAGAVWHHVVGTGVEQDGDASGDGAGGRHAGDFGRQGWITAWR